MYFNGIVITVLVAFSTLLIGVSAKLITKRETDGQLDNQSQYLPSMEKRPFCNAFTGCGKKRSNSYESLETRDIMSPLMNRLSRQILKDVKQWQLLRNRPNDQMSIQDIVPLMEYMPARRRR